LYTLNVVLFGNNIYIPKGNNIYKLMLSYMEEEEAKVKIVKLDSSEYKKNFDD
jgi:hypothetical protein